MGEKGIETGAGTSGTVDVAPNPMLPGGAQGVGTSVTSGLGQSSSASPKLGSVPTDQIAGPLQAPSSIIGPDNS
jgi:hypothetical protein